MTECEMKKTDEPEEYWFLSAFLTFFYGSEVRRDFEDTMYASDRMCCITL